MRPRGLTETERSIIERILAQDPVNARELRRQLDRAEVIDEFGPGDPSVFLSVDKANSPQSALASPPELVAQDEHGTTIHIQLHVRDGYLYELEFYTYGDAVIGQIDPRSLTPASEWYRQQGEALSNE